MAKGLTMNFLDAAYQILKQTGTPLHYADITRRALTANLLDTKGQTPEATMSARLYVDTRNPNSRFRRVSRNIFGLAEAPPPEIVEQVKSLNQQTRTNLQKRLMEMPPDRFEALITELLRALGFYEESIKLTRYSGDNGIDVRGVLNAGHITEIRAAVQVKRWKHNIPAPVIQGVRGSLTVHEQGIIITTSGFSKGAIEEAQATGKTRISLVDGEKLLDLLVQHNIGVQTEQFVLHTLDDEWWSELVDGGNDTVTQPIANSTVPPKIVFPLPIQASAHGRLYHAELLSNKGVVRYDGTEYTSPSKAGQVATGWKSCNGWSLWRFQDTVTGEWKTIDEIRFAQMS